MIRRDDDTLLADPGEDFTRSVLAEAGPPAASTLLLDEHRGLLQALEVEQRAALRPPRWRRIAMGAAAAVILVAVGLSTLKPPPPTLGQAMRPLPALVVQQGSKLVYTLPPYERYELSDATVIALIEKGSGLVEIVGLRKGRVTLTLYATDATYRGTIEVGVPIETLICNAVREQHAGKPLSQLRQIALEKLREAKSLAFTREEHASNGYRALLKAREAACLLQTGPELTEAQALVAESRTYLDGRFKEVTVEVQKAISLRDWEALKVQLDELQLLLPDPRDWRHIRARKLREFYADKLPD